MKKVLLAILVLITWCTGSLAQSKYENELRDRFWDSKDPARNSIEIPEKWADESAVILYLEENYTYTNNGKKMYNPSYFHERVKLLDKAAIEAFSEFTYNKDQHVGAVFVNFYREQTTVGIKIGLNILIVLKKNFLILLVQNMQLLHLHVLVQFTFLCLQAV